MAAEGAARGRVVRRRPVPGARRVEVQESWVLRRSAWVVAAGAGAGALVLFVGLVFAPYWPSLVPRTLAGDNEATAEDSVRRHAIALATAIGALTAGALAWGRLDLSRQENRRAEGAQFTDRYTRAVEQLGHADPAVRLGALYALEALAHDSPADRVSIADVVCAYVRHHSVQRDDPGRLVTTDRPRGERVSVRVDGQAVDYRAAITIALRLPAEWDLPTRDLHGVVAVDLRLDEARLGAVDLSGVLFTGHTSFSGVTFTGDAFFQDATFAGRAWFDEATFARLARFERTVFNDDSSPFGGARFSSASFAGPALFTKARFAGEANFGAARFAKEAMFDEAVFSGAAHFDAATFTDHARFRRVTFGAAWYRGAVFLSGATFSAVRFARIAQFFCAKFGEPVNFRHITFPSDSQPGGAERTFTRFLGATFTRGAYFDDGFDPGADFEQRPGGPFPVWVNRASTSDEGSGSP